jgi:hypothetical protein
MAVTVAVALPLGEESRRRREDLGFGQGEKDGGGGIAQGARMLGWVSQAMQDKQAHQVAGGAPVREGEGIMLQVYCAA